MKIKVFISQPMANKTNEEIKLERDEIIFFLNKKFGYETFEIIDSFFKDAPHEAKPLWFLGKSFELLSGADICVFAKGWENARGCHMEYLACKKYEIETLDYWDLLK